MAIETKQVTNKFFETMKEIGESDKCPPQAKLIVDTVKQAGGRIARAELIALLKRTPEEGGLTTNQTAERILAFYRPKLAALGVLKEVSVVTEIQVEVPDKPAKAPKAEAPEGEAPVAVKRSKKKKSEAAEAVAPETGEAAAAE